MSSGQTLRLRDETDFSFLEALSFEEDRLLSQPEQSLNSAASSVFPATRTKSIELPQTAQLKANAAIHSPGTTYKTRIATKMTSTKAQIQCLELCRKTTAYIDRVSIRLLEYLTTQKPPRLGFEILAHDFLDTCQILFSLEAGLGECSRNGQTFSSQMITALEMKFRVAQADFRMLEEMMNKLLGNSGKIKKRWGQMFGDNDVKKLSNALKTTIESLRMSALMFQWNLGTDKIESAMGIGYTALAAALDRMDHKLDTGFGNASGQKGLRSIPPTPSSNAFRDEVRSENSQASVHSPEFAHNYDPRQPSGPPPAWSSRVSPFQSDTNPTSLDQSLSHDYRGILAAASFSPPYGSNLLSNSPPTESYDRASLLNDNQSHSARAESETYHDDFAALDMGHFKLVHLAVDPSSMPRARPRNPADSGPANLKAALVSAVRSKNHKLVDQLLDRGVPANTGPTMHALKEALLSHDEETVRLLLLFGADPNDPDRDGNTPLSFALRISFVAGATILLKYGADPNLVSGPDLESPLALAVIANNVGFSHLLLSYNGDIKHRTAEGNTLLIAAIKRKTPKKFIDLLLEYGSDPNAKSQKGETALFEALQLGRADIVISLLEKGADANLPGPKHMLWPSVHYPSCLQILLDHGADHKKAPGVMELSVSTNNMESVKILLKAGVDPNIKKDGVYTPLCTAIRDDRSELLHLLLSKGADPNTKASEYPAFKCVTHKRLHFLPALVAAGADLHEPKGILETAVASKNIEAMNWLLDQGVDPNEKSLTGMSPLTTAIREEDIDMVDLLLLRGANPHKRGQDWPLCMAVRSPPILKRILNVVSKPQAFKGVMEMAVHANQLESVKMLLEAGVSVEDKNGGVFSPLTTALREDRRDIVRFLLTEGGADVNAPGEHLPIVKALRRFRGEDTEMLRLLLHHGADANKIYRGWNAMMQAVENGDVDVLKLICQASGVDLEAKDEAGMTVVDLATSRGLEDAVQILEEGDIRVRR